MKNNKDILKKKQSVRVVLRKYGGTRNGIISTLSSHVEDCQKCREDYQILAQKWAEEMIELIGANLISDMDSLEKEFDFNALRIFVGNELY